MRFTSSIFALAFGLSSTAVANLGVPSLRGPVPSLDISTVTGSTSALAIPGKVVATSGDIGPVQSVYVILASLEVKLTNEVNALVETVTSTADLAVCDFVLSALEDIANDITATIGSVVAIALPASLEIVGDVVSIVSDVLAAALAIVDLTASTATNLVFSLTDDVKALVIAELAVVLNLVGPLVKPILVFAKDVTDDVAIGADVEAILNVLNTALGLVGVPAFDAGI